MRFTSYGPALAAALVLVSCAEPSAVSAPPAEPSAIPANVVTAPAAAAPRAGDPIVFQDNFDSYGYASNLRRNYARAGAISLAAGRSGTAVRFSYSSGSTYNLLERSLPAAGDLYVSYWYRTSPGADPSNAGTNRWGLTMLRAERATGGRWQVSVARSALLFGIDDSSMPNVYQNLTQSPRFGTTNDGAWHQLTARLVGAPGGYALVWVDGVLVTDTRGLGYTHPAGGVALLRFPGELAASPRTPFTIDIDDLVVWRPGAGVPPVDTTTPPTDTTTPPPPPPAPVARVLVTPASVSLLPGGSAQLAVAVQDSAGNALTGRSIAWSSSNQAIATVSSSGAVQAVAAGSITVTATSEGRSGTAQVTVAPVPVASVSVTLNASSVLVGNSTQAVATLRDAQGNALTGRTVSWQSSNPSVASVSAAGLVTAVAEGTANIVATSEGRTGQAPIAVTAPPPSVASVSVTPGSAALLAGASVQLAATLRSASGAVLTGRPVSWSTSNGAVASVSSTGLVRALTAGTAVITATSEGQRGSSSITVSVPPTPGPGASEPAYSAGTHALILRDNFDYASRSAMMAMYPTGRFTEYVSLIPGRNGSSGAARLSYGNGGAYDIILGPEDRLTSVGRWNGTLPEKAGPYTHFLFSTWFRVSSGADPAANSDWGVKGFMFWHSGTQQGGRYQNAVNQGSADGRTRGPKGANPCNAQSGMNLYKTADGCAPLFSAIADGQWHRFTIEIYAGNDRSGLRGERYWVDGQLIYDDVGQNVGAATSAGHYDYASPIRHWMVFGNFINETARSPFFTFDIDDWQAWTTR